MAWSLELLSFGRGGKFPAFLTWRAGVDKLALRMMRPLFDAGVRPERYSRLLLLLELHALKYFDCYLEREQQLSEQRLRGHVFDRPVDMYSTFSDPAKYDGKVPTGHYLASVFKTAHGQHHHPTHLNNEVSEWNLAWRCGCD